MNLIVLVIFLWVSLITIGILTILLNDTIGIIYKYIPKRLIPIEYHTTEHTPMFYDLEQGVN